MFKVTRGQRLKKSLPTLYLRNGWMDLNQTCTFVSLETTITQVDFGDIDLIFKVAHLKNVEKRISQMYEYKPDSYRYTINKKTD